MTDTPAATAKKELRASAAAVRADLHERLGGTARSALRDTGLGFLGRTAPVAVSGFQSMGTEIDCSALMQLLAAQGWTTCLPVVTGMGLPLTFRAWRAGNPLEPGHWDIPVPCADAPEIEPDVFLVPLLAFDDAGYRLGYGGGFYDRTLELARKTRDITAVGLAYAGQWVQAVPHDNFDQRLDWVVTEQGPMRFGH